MESNLKFDANIEKDLPLESPEIVTQKELDQEQAGKSVHADLYFHRLFTVVPVNHDLMLGIFPEDQRFHRNLVFAWSNARSLMTFADSKWKKVEFSVPSQVRFSSLVPLTSGVFGLPHVSNGWKLKDLDNTDLLISNTY